MTTHKNEPEPHGTTESQGGINEQEKTLLAESLIQSAAAIAEKCPRAKILIYADAAEDAPLERLEPFADRTIYVTKTDTETREQTNLGRHCLTVPNIPLSRTGQIKIAVFLGLSHNLITVGDLVVFLTGQAGSGHFDSIIVTDVGSEFEMYASTDDTAPLPKHIRPAVVDRVIELASELGTEGREGKPVGALFVIGDTQHVLPLTRQLVINPFRGYPEDQRNILDPNLEETIKEFATIDGAFLIRGDGVIETCGAYIKSASQDEYELPRGLGARHHAAAAITSLTDALAVTISESTGTVTVFRKGQVVTEIEKPRSSRARSKPTP
ncbi:MAG: DNA integrity scanning protein DisA nucleotide-binding domain protein [Phycisphaeraceae bacterium]